MHALLRQRFLVAPHARAGPAASLLEHGGTRVWSTAFQAAGLRFKPFRLEGGTPNASCLNLPAGLSCARAQAYTLPQFAVLFILSNSGGQTKMSV
jgi:hypothetical protein